MPHRPVILLDRERNPIATADVECREDHYSGSVDLAQMPTPLRHLFEEYEEIVNGQVFGLLDQIEDRVDAAAMSVFFDGHERRTRDLQILPGLGRISFRVIDAPSGKDPRS